MAFRVPKRKARLFTLMLGVVVDTGRVVTVPTVGVTVVVDVVEDNDGFQISNRQKLGSLIGLDSGS